MGRPIPQATPERCHRTNIRMESILAEERYRSRELQDWCTTPSARFPADSDTDESIDGFEQVEEVDSEMEEDMEGNIWADPSGGTLSSIFRAASEGELEELSVLLREADQQIVNERGPDGDCALHLAAVYGYHACVELLLEAGADPYLPDRDGALPLHDAAAGGHLQVVQLLAEAAPGTLNCTDDDGDTPLHNAARGSYADVVAYLLLRGADARKMNKGMETALDVIDVGERGLSTRILLQQACTMRGVGSAVHSLA